MKKIKISQVAKINSDSIKGNIEDTILYLDTSSVTKGIFSEPQILNSKNDKIPSRAKRKVRENTILISTVRPNLCHFGIIKKPKKNLIVSTGFVTIDASPELIDANYLYYLLTSNDTIKYLDKIASTSVSAYPSFTPNDIKNYEISIIENINFQKKIGNLLYKIEEKIELNNKINSELEAMAKTIYDYWFLQFEFPNEEGKPYKSSGGKMVWNEELKREIPEIFQNLLLKEIKNISVITGKTPSTKDETNFGNEVPFITIEDLRENVFVVNTKRKLSKKGANAQEKKYIPSGSICVSCIATIGEIAITTETSQTNQQINSVICGGEEIRNYLYFYLKNIFLNFKVKSGNIFSNMNKEEFESVKILLPTENILVKFSKIISLILSKIEVNTKENQELTSLRDFLLPLLMNGQVGFKEE
jgi:type I restriction enzyme S subunit